MLPRNCEISTPSQQLTPSKQALRVTVVGDTHGQYHDVCHMCALWVDRAVS